MSTLHRSPTRASGLALLAILLLVAVACTPAAGPLGTPSGPAVSAQPTDEPPPSDIAPSASTETPTGTASPSTSEAPTDVAESPSAGTGSPSTEPSASPEPTATPASSPTGTMIVRAYFMLGSFADNAGLVPVLREVPETKAAARASLLALLDGPRGAELEASPAMSSSIPDGVRLRDISIADGVATVLLSREWLAAAATFQQETATAQVVYTLTQFSAVRRVRLQVEGESPGSEVSRADFQATGLLPAIFVDRPAWGAAGGNPMRLSGIANVFEAQFVVQVLDGKGRLLVEKPVQASCGTGCWGTFRTDVAYTIGRAQYGTLRVFEPSAKDGTPTNVTEYRIWLTP